MDEFATILRARQFIKDTGIEVVPVDVEAYAMAASATIKVRHDMDPGESGLTFPLRDGHAIIVNGYDTEERRRFTVLHEIAHIVLKLPSVHQTEKIKTSALMSYRRRPSEEIMCDVFAAECLLPYRIFKKDVDDVDISLEEVRRLARKYEASVTCTASRFASNCDGACAFVLVEAGRIRYVSRSKLLRERNGWIDIGSPVPPGSVACQLISHRSKDEGCDEIYADIWFSSGVSNSDLATEEAMLIREWDQCLSLISLDEDLEPLTQQRSTRQDDERPLLRELDGVLPWPSKSRRR